MLPSEKHREETINFVRSLYDRPVMGYELAIVVLPQHHTNPLIGIVQYSFLTVAILNNNQRNRLLKEYRMIQNRFTLSISLKS